MTVKINIPAYFRSYTDGLDVVEVRGATVGECLNELIIQFPEISSKLFYEPGDLDESVVVCVNREVITAWEEPLKQLLAAGDELSLVVMAAGG